MSKFLIPFAWLFAAIFGSDSYKALEQYARSTKYIVDPENLGTVLNGVGTSMTSVELGFNPETNDFAYIVANDGMTPSTVEAKLPIGYLQIASIKPAGMSFTRVAGNVKTVRHNKAFLLGIETIVALDIANDGINFRHADTDAGDLATIQMRTNVDYLSLETDDMTKFSVLLTTADGTPIIFTETILGIDYLVATDGVYEATRSDKATNAAEIMADNGQVVSAHYLDSVEFVDSMPVTLVRSLTGFAVGFENGQNVVVQIDDNKKVTAKTLDSDVGAILSINYLTGQAPTAIVDDGNIMQTLMLDVIDPHLGTMLGYGKKTPATGGKDADLS